VIIEFFVVYVRAMCDWSTNADLKNSFSSRMKVDGWIREWKYSGFFVIARKIELNNMD
jgi:hypothetical protein